uniref:hairy/enhancer-of-split related with YRPW motif protein 1-like isoform X2 n=1 Tax=Myxine glutinosa TaxID=7769 RepID=UPI00358E4B3C
MKRTSQESSSESELEGSVSEEEVGFVGHDGMTFPRNLTQGVARKRRRGIIEKRRRDRINSSLAELRRLVPMAGEKQTSGKLEKAEILQMTVDHLKALNSLGGKCYYEAYTVAVDYRNLGFRECLAEVARFMGMTTNAGDSGPWAPRLVAHLSSFARQRDATSLAMLLGTGHLWPPTFSPPLALAASDSNLDRLAGPSAHMAESLSPPSAMLLSSPLWLAQMSMHGYLTGTSSLLSHGLHSPLPTGASFLAGGPDLGRLLPCKRV